MRNLELESLLNEYTDYAELFAKQIYRKEVWSEQTGCELEDEYFGYVACCGKRLYDFGTWYEHTQGQPFPKEWEANRNTKCDLLSFQA